jgi:hypothetical protein
VRTVSSGAELGAAVRQVDPVVHGLAGPAGRWRRFPGWRASPQAGRFGDGHELRYQVGRRRVRKADRLRAGDFTGVREVAAGWRKRRPCWPPGAWTAPGSRRSSASLSSGARPWAVTSDNGYYVNLQGDNILGKVAGLRPVA